MTEIDVAAALLRLVLGVTMVAHGYNHLFGGGGVAGTTRWFAGVGLRPARVHAFTSGALEIAAGVGLLIGFLAPLWCAAVIGVAVVAGVAVHARNGFFVFREGYEYVLMMAVAAAALGLLGPGSLSADSRLGITIDGWAGLGMASAGAVGAALLLAVSWRPAKTTS